MTNNNYTQPTNRPFIAWAITTSLVATQLLLALAFGGCEEDSKASDSEDAAAQCTRPGESKNCECQPGRTGTKVCLNDGTYSSCRCYASASKPCDEPGVEFACPCSGGAEGKQICLVDGTFTKCVCPASNSTTTAQAGASGANSSATGAAGSLSAAAAQAAKTAGPCPSGFTCKEMSSGGMTAPVCVKGTNPPLCNTKEECTKAGLSSAECIPVEYSGMSVNVCAQVCK